MTDKPINVRFPISTLCEVFQLEGEGFLPNNITISIYEQPLAFPLANADTLDWQLMRGYTIRINQFHFMAVPFEHSFLTYELESGMRIVSTIDTLPLQRDTETIGQALAHYAMKLGCLVEFNKQSLLARIQQMQQLAITKCGERPTIALTARLFPQETVLT